MTTTNKEADRESSKHKKQTKDKGSNKNTKRTKNKEPAQRGLVPSSAPSIEDMYGRIAS